MVRVSGRVVATVSLIEDAELGLPCDDLYPRELRELRAGGRRLGEVAALAIARTSARDGLAHLGRLIQAVGVFGDRVGLDELCITVHPRHVRFYEGHLGFVRFGPLASYAAVNGAPAVGLRLPVREGLQHLTEVKSHLAPRLFAPESMLEIRLRLGRSPFGDEGMQVFHRAARDSAGTRSGPSRTGAGARVDAHHHDPTRPDGSPPAPHRATAASGPNGQR